MDEFPVTPEGTAINFSPLSFPVWTMHASEAEKEFGEYYRYDLPKWCAENKLHCYFVAPTLLYIVFPMSYKKL